MKKITLLFFCFAGFYSQAQDERQVVIIDRNSPTYRSTTASTPRRLVDHKHVFKFDPIRMAIGEVNFAYERRIDEQSTLEVELGPTVSNLGRMRFDQGGMNVYFSRQSNMGVLASLAYRFYPLDGRPAFNQLYISPKFKYRRYNETLHAEDNMNTGMPSTLSDTKGFTNEAIFTFNFGYQQWLAQRFSFDYYIGFGLASYSSKSYTPDTGFDGNTGQWTEVWRPQTVNYARFVGTIGIKVGIGK